MLVDLILNLEQSLTLPRVDFLRRHAETIHAMSAHAHENRVPAKTETEYVVGDAETLCWGAQLETALAANVIAGQEKFSTDPRHIGHMARAIPRHPDFRNGGKRDTNLNASANDGSSSRAAVSELILGDRLKSASAVYPKTVARSLAQSPLASATVATESTNLHPEVSQPLDVDACRQYQIMSPDNAIASGFDPKLHPVVGPRRMDVSPTLQITNNRSMPLLTATQSTSRYSQRLRRNAPPRIRTSSPNSGYQSGHV
ncbi:hypothetical protein GGI21_005888 [Coemansia aciculifera]|nr:hypothetical protein GGI21_005888 [Coemansia aciculifera]